MSATLLRPGDRVEVRGPLRALPGDPQGPAYRGAPATRYAPVGVPCLVPV